MNGRFSLHRFHHLRVPSDEFRLEQATSFAGGRSDEFRRANRGLAPYVVEILDVCSRWILTGFRLVLAGLGEVASCYTFSRT